MYKGRTDGIARSFLIWENGIAILKSTNKKGIIFYDKSVFQGGKFIEVKKELMNLEEIF